MAKRKTKRKTTAKAPAERGPFDEIRHVKKRAFLLAYSEVPAINRAAKLAGIHRSNHSLWLRGDSAYRRAFRIAHEMAIEDLEVEARRRATKGVVEPVFYQGQRCGRVRKFSDVLLIFMLKAAKPKVYRDNFRHEIGGPDGGAIKIENAQSAARELVTDPEAAKMIAEISKRMTYGTKRTAEVESDEEPSPDRDA